MANDLNTIGIIGRLTRPAEATYSQSGFCILTFSIASNRGQKKPDGTWGDKASFFNCKMLGKMAEGVSKYLTQGQQVAINGYLDQETWKDSSTGQNRSKVVIIVNSLSLIGGQKQDSNNQYSSNNGYNQNSYNNSNSNHGYNNQPNQNRQPQGQYNGNQGNYQQNQGGYQQPQQNTMLQNGGPEGFADDSIPF